MGIVNSFREARDELEDDAKQPLLVSGTWQVNILATQPVPVRSGALSAAGGVPKVGYTEF